MYTQTRRSVTNPIAELRTAVINKLNDLNGSATNKGATSDLTQLVDAIYNLYKTNIENLDRQDLNQNHFLNQDKDKQYVRSYLLGIAPSLDDRELAILDMLEYLMPSQLLFLLANIGDPAAKSPNFIRDIDTKTAPRWTNLLQYYTSVLVREDDLEEILPKLGEQSSYWNPWYQKYFTFFQSNPDLETKLRELDAIGANTNNMPESIARTLRSLIAQFTPRTTTNNVSSIPPPAQTQTQFMRTPSSYIRTTPQQGYSTLRSLTQAYPPIFATGFNP